MRKKRRSDRRFLSSQQIQQNQNPNPKKSQRSKSKKLKKKPGILEIGLWQIVKRDLIYQLPYLQAKPRQNWLKLRIKKLKKISNWLSDDWVEITNFALRLLCPIVAILIDWLINWLIESRVFRNWVFFFFGAKRRVNVYAEYWWQGRY